jgi:hypothetical protein
MTFDYRMAYRSLLLLASIGVLMAVSIGLRADTGTCGGVSVTIPFNDVPGSNPFFCAIAEAYLSGLTNGTSATTYSPSANVPREQMAAFITRTMDQSLRRGSRRAALDQWFSPTASQSIGRTTVGDSPDGVKSDGADLWVANHFGDTVSRVRASDGKLLETWTGATRANGILVARGRVYVTGGTSPGQLYEINPAQPPGNVTLIANSLGDTPEGIAFDGFNIWTVNDDGSVSRIDPVSGTVSIFPGFFLPQGILYDGSNIWITDRTGTLLRLNSVGVVTGTVGVGDNPREPIFDGLNIWVPNAESDSVTVVRVKDSQSNPLSQPFVVATLTGNGLDVPWAAAFDGERILVTNFLGHRVSLWKAADLIPLGSVSTGANSGPLGACSDGLNFWVTLAGTNRLARF